MEQRQLNGESEILLERIKAEIEGIRALNKAQWDHHDDRAKDLQCMLTAHLKSKAKPNGLSLTVVISTTVGVLTLCYAGIWSLGGFINQQMTMNEKRVDVELDDIKEEILRIRQWKDSTEKTIPMIEERIDGMGVQMRMLHKNLDEQE